MIVHLDSKKWMTPKQYAAKKKVTKQVVNNWIARKKIDSLYIKDWDLRLIRITEAPL